MRSSSGSRLFEYRRASWAAGSRRMGGRVGTSELLVRRALTSHEASPPAALSSFGLASSPLVPLQRGSGEIVSAIASMLKLSPLSGLSTSHDEALPHLLVAQHEELVAVVRVEHDLTHVGEDPLPGRPLHGVDEVLLHDLLEAKAHLAHKPVIAGVEQRALDGRQTALERDDQRLVVQVGLGLRRALAVVLGLEANDLVGHRGEGLARYLGCHRHETRNLQRPRMVRQRAWSRPTRRLRWPPIALPTGVLVPPLISYEEALALGEIEDHAEIEALVERAFQARRDRFGDSTDMCSLVNAKSGGCAEDCGFCAQSRFAEADTPMHAMMSP